MAAPIVFDFVMLEDENNRRARRRERLFRDRSNPLELYDDVEIYTKLRFRRHDLLDLTRELGPDLEFEWKQPRKGSLPALLQVLILVS